MAQETGFLDMFGCCTGLKDLCGGLERALVRSVVISRENLTMEISAFFTRQPALEE